MEGLGLLFSGLFCPLLLPAHAERELTTCRIMGAGQGLEACTAIEKYKAWRSSHHGFCICLSAQVLLAKHKSDGMFYAVKVLQKKSILKKKEVPGLGPRHLLSCFLTAPRPQPQVASKDASQLWAQRWPSRGARWCLGC